MKTSYVIGQHFSYVKESKNGANITVNLKKSIEVRYIFCLIATTESLTFEKNYYSRPKKPITTIKNPKLQQLLKKISG